MELRTQGMTAGIERAATHYTVDVRGDLDLDDSLALGRQLTLLAERGPAVLLLDMSSVRYFGCSGISALMTGLTAAQRHGGMLCVDPASACVHRVLGLTGLSELLADHDGMHDRWPDVPMGPGPGAA